MLQNIVFTDNIFLLSRMLSVISQSIQLDFYKPLFTKKIQSDIIFCGETLKLIFDRLNKQQHLHDYLETMKCIYYCSVRLLQILSELEIDNRGLFANFPEQITKLKKDQEKLNASIRKKVSDTDIDKEVTNMVSELELSKLLNFE